jgi:hypothetical protein
VYQDNDDLRNLSDFWPLVDRTGIKSGLTTLYRDGKNCAVLRSLRLVPGSNKKAKDTAPASVHYVTLTNHTACR